MRGLMPLLLAVAAALPGAAATLERLTLDEMIQQSTAIVRGRVSAAGSLQRGPLIYSRWRIQVAERWKGPAGSEAEVLTPGGTFQGIRQSFSGVPALKEGAEYVFFLWTGRSGLTQIIGLSQGLFDLGRDSSGRLVVTRPASGETLLDPKSGAVVEDQPVRMRLSEMQGRIRSALAAVGQ